MSIKLVALDLDGTTLDSAGNLPKLNRLTLEESISKGIKIVIATGRSYYSLPKDVTGIKGLEYAVTSNGAQIRNLLTEEVLFSDCLSPEAVRKAAKIIMENNYDTEVFVDGTAYIEKSSWNDIIEGRITYRRISYIKETRKPVDDVVSFMLRNESKVENINICFGDMSLKPKIRETLKEVEDIATVTTSFDNNWEIGGLYTSKANAIIKLGKSLSISKEEIMSIGDSPNDIPMILVCGKGVAVGNAKDSVKAVADYVTLSNDECGVSAAIKKFVTNI